MVDTVARARELRPELVKRAEEIEHSGDLPDDLVDTLRSAGYLRLAAPPGHGGASTPLPDLLAVLTELARGDGSTGWVVGQLALSDLIMSCLPADAQDAIYVDGPDVCTAGAVAPKGRAVATADGWRINGRWPYVTGCRRARWFYLNCVVMTGRSVRMTEAGLPMTRIVAVPAENAEIVDTWRVLGLRGTGSHDVVVRHTTCAPERGFDLATEGPAKARAVSGIAQSSLIIAAVVAGIAAGALAEIGQLAEGGKRPAFSTRRLAQSPIFQDRLGEAHMTLQAAQALLDRIAEDTWHSIGADRPLSRFDRATVRATATHVADLTARVVDTAHALGGGTTVYDTSPLQRRLRDIHTATQHFVAARDSYATLGAMLVGEDDGIGPF
jgi:alkylation response protein AidB-like acyl-CoA dehydrogenase